MTSEQTIGPCPVCGGTSQVVTTQHKALSFGQCLADCQLILPLPTWQRLSHAAALLRAWDAFGARLPSGWAFGVAQIWDDDTQQWTIEAQATDRPKGRILVATGATAHAALIALAAQIGAGDAS
jgi:hypothetical protein